MKRIICVLLSALLIVGMLAGCGGAKQEAPAASGEKTEAAPAPAAEAPKDAKVLRASTPSDPGAAWTVALETIAKLIEERTNGAYHIDVYPNASLSENSEKTMTEQVYVGTLDMCITPASLASSEWSAFSVPFQFSNRDHIWRVCETDVVKEMMANMEPKGMKVLGIVENGFRQITNNVHEIRVPDDAVGVKLRTPQAPSSIAQAEMMGFNAVAISAGELYVALQQGTADGQENALNTIYDKGFYDVQKYLTVINYNWSPALCGINIDLWNSLDADTQAIFAQAVKEGCDVANKMMAENDEGYIQKLKDKGMEVYICTDADLELWRAKMADAPSIYAETVGPDLMARFTEAVNATR